MKIAEHKLAKIESLNSTSKERVPTLDERRTQELVFALVAPVGSGATTISHEIIRQISTDYGYDTQYIKLSDVINEYLLQSGLDPVEQDDPNRIEKLQDAGNKMRLKHSNNALAVMAVEKIHESRPGTRKIDTDRRRCTVIDSLKNPEEARLLENVYGDLFWLIGVFCKDLSLSYRC